MFHQGLCLMARQTFVKAGPALLVHASASEEMTAGSLETTGGDRIQREKTYRTPKIDRKLGHLQK